MKGEITSNVQIINIIKNEHQLRATQEQIARLKESLKNRPPKGAPKELVDATRGQIIELIRELGKEVYMYNRVRGKPYLRAKIRVSKRTTMDAILRIPIEYRIAYKLTIEAFAQLVGIHSRQIARYERETYRNVTTPTFFKILERLGMRDVNIDFNELQIESQDQPKSTTTTRKAAGSRTPQQTKR